MAADHPTPTDRIVLIHGPWMTPLSWEGWRARYASRGYRVLAPAWPGLDAGEEELRRDASAIGGLTIARILDRYERIVRAHDEPPMLMGHSLGGAFVQVLLDRGLGAAGIAIASVPPKGVRVPALATVRSALPVLRNPFDRSRTRSLTVRQFRHAFGTGLSAEESARVHARYAVPAPAGVLVEGVLANLHAGSALTVDYRRALRPPLLLIAGGADRVVPASVSRANACRYAGGDAHVDYKEFPGRGHYTVGQDGWQEVADYALAWATEHAAADSGPLLRLA
jgi:pimeloyl-ACP methyl ester carboxylesterase